MSNFMGVGIFCTGLNRADLGCWRLTLRPGLKPSFLAYVKTANISVSSCSEYARSTKITKTMHFDNYSKIYNYQQNNIQIRLRAYAFVLNF